MTLPAIIPVHYDLLRDRRIRRHEDLVPGRAYMSCHVPLDNPFTGGVDPGCFTLTLMSVAFRSHNDIHTHPYKHRFRDQEALARVLADPVLNEKAWLYAYEYEGHRGMLHTMWKYCTDHGMDGGEPEVGPEPYNYLLDIYALAQAGIKVLPTTSVEYTMAESLREERDHEELDWGTEEW